MANRVVLGELPGGGVGLRVSRPGRNVLNENLAPKDVSFDSRWDTSSKIIVSGTVTRSGGVQSHTINFGETLSYVPSVLVMVNGQGERVWITDWHQPSSVIDNVFLEEIFDTPQAKANFLDVNSSWNDHYWKYAVYNNRLVISWRTPPSGAVYPNGSMASYVVLRR